MNNYAVSSDGIATALQDSASALMEGGNDLEQAVALVAAANRVVQDPSSVGSALRTISLRLRGTSVEVLEEMGEETDGVVESTSKLQEKLKALTGVDIVDMNGAYKDTYTILKEIGSVWKELDPMDQAAALEMMAGKNRANALAAILNNMADLEGAYNDALDAEGSALKENEAYLDSIQGRIDLFTNSVQTMWMNFINSDVIKFLVDAGSLLVKIADNIGLIETAIIGVAGYLALIKKKDFTWLQSLVNIKNIKNPSGGGIKFLEGEDLVNHINDLNSAIKQGPEEFNKYKNAQKGLNNGMHQMIQSTEKAEYTTSDYTMALKGMTPAAQQAAAKQQLLNTAISVGTMVIVGVVSALANNIDNVKTLAEEYEELQSSISSLENGIGSLDSELTTIQEQINALSNKNLTLAEAEELKKLKEQSKELERQKELQESILKGREKQNQAKSLAMINNYLKTSAAYQQEAVESGKTWGKVIGQVAGALVGLAAGVAITGFTGGLGAGAGVATGATLSAGVSSAITMGLSSVGSSLGGMAGESLGSKWNSSQYETDGSLISWYESYTKAIEKAEQEALTAENEYLNNLTDESYEKWQNKVDEVTTLQTEMYNGLEEMQGYINNLEYNDQTANIIDGYNNLLAHIDVKSNEDNINAQIASIESLKSEFYELSKGVDENGKNVALSAEEYARYHDIVNQILAYTPSLIQGYDAEGNAILGTADAQYTYNQLIAESIELLKQQRQEVAKQAISNTELGAVIDSANANYDAAIKGASNYDRLNYGKDNTNLTRTANIIAEIIGVEQNGWDKFWGINEADYILENVESIAKHKDEIIQAMADTGYYGGNELDEYSDWFDGLIQSARTAADQANAEIRERLYVAPEASDYYDDLSGSQLAFINSYIASIEGLKDKTESEIAEIANEIVGITSLIGSSKNLQDSINDLIALDPSSMPVVTYRKKFEELWTEVKDIIPKDQQGALYAQLFPDAGQIDAMMADVQEKLAVSSRGLVKNLSLEELRIAYKITPELSNDITFEELRQEIQERLPKATGPIVETYSALTEQVTQFNEILFQTSEIILDNTKVTQEYKDSLVELGVSEEELAECFDSTNSLVVTNAKKLNDLVKRTKKNTTQNVQLAKSQARLQYYELYKKMALLVDANGKVASGNVGLILSYYKEMNALEKTIARYSMLEAQLLGATNAYEEFQKAQEIDSETDYIGNVENMVLALGEAFNTAELGSETAQAAIIGLVPESVYADLDTVEEKMAAIYDYFKQGPISQYFDVTFDEDGNIESVEMKLGNLRKFIEDGLWGDMDGDGINPFVGSDWQHFELNQTWLDSLPEGTDVLQALADQMNVTKEVAFAFVKSFKDHDIEWLDGDYATFFDQMLASTNEGKLQLYTERLADITAEKAKLAAEEEKLTKQLKDGSITQEEYDAKIAELTEKQEEYNEKLKEYNEKLAEAKNASQQNIFGVGAEGTQYEGKVDYQIKTSSEIEATDNMDDLDNWIERNEKVNQLYAEQEEAQEAYADALEEAEAAKSSGDADRIAEANEELKKAENAYKNVTNAVAEAIKKRDEFTEPTVLEIEVALDEVEKQIESTRETFDKKLASGTHTITVEIDGQTIQQSVASTDELLESCFHMDEDGYWVINAGVNKSELEQKYPEILNYVNLLNSNTTLTAHLNDTEAQKTLDDLSTQIQEIIDLLSDIKVALSEDSKTTFLEDCQNLLNNCGLLGKVINIGVKAVTGQYSDTGKSGAQKVNRTAHVRGTAHKSGDWGLPKDEHDSLVGELGPELVCDPSTSRYYTVGDSGAEMVDLPKGAIIFNHKQTESLLKNGYVTSRGKAYAEGNAHVTIWPNSSSKTQWEGTGYSSWDDPTYDLSEALSDVSNSLSNASDSLSDAANDILDATDEFKEVFDWVEVRLEEIDETIGLLEAAFENAAYYTEKNNIIDSMIDANNTKLTNLKAGYQEYADYATKLLTEIPQRYQVAAQDGSIAIETFVGEADEATLEAINNYREWAQKAADLKQQAQEVITAIRDLAMQKFDNAYEAGDVRATVEDSQTEKLQNAVDYDEERGLITSDEYYIAMMENSNKKIEYLTNAREAMQKELDKAVEAGQIVRGSNEWYEMIDQLYQIDAQIDEAIMELEEFQNAINDLYWDNFDQLINRISYLKDETQSLIDLMDSDDMFTTPDEGRKYEGGTVEYWTADDVNWTDEGLASLGLYAQQMEIAEFEARQYAKAIDDLTADYEAGLYSEDEYLEKLKELQDAQYDSIEAYEEAKNAIMEMNEARVDSIKDGISKEIEAYEELINKKKEALDAEKDLYDFQKSTMEQQKNIADIERQLAALANDTSLSAAARRKQLEAQLVEAQYELQDTYYNRSVEDKQEALSKELEDFQAEKDAELLKWEEYLGNVELVIAESLGIVQENASSIYDTLMAKAEEYDLTISDAIMTPWQDGVLAVSDYQTEFDTAMSHTMDQLEALKNKWQEVIDKMAETGKAHVDTINQENANYIKATEKKETSTGNGSSNKSNSSQQKAITVGGKVNAKGAKIYSSIGGKASNQYYSKDPVYTVLAQSGDWIKVRHHSLKSGVTGFFKKGQVKAYAKGSIGVDEDQWALIDELGDELQIVPGKSGRLEYIKKGTGIVPADLTSNLMSWGELDPQDMLDRNRPTITAPHIVNNEINISMNIAEVVHIDEVTNDTLPDLTKVVKKQMDSYMLKLNNAIKAKVR